MAEYGADQRSAGFRAMMMLAALVRRGGRPAAVAPTIALRPGEKQYGWFPVTVDRAERRIAVITNQRLIVGEDHPLAEVDRVRPVPGEWSVALTMRDHTEPLLLSGPWVPWMSVVICAELYGTAWPPDDVPTLRHEPALEPAVLEPAGLEPAVLEPAVLEPVDFEPADFKPVGFESAGLEPGRLEPAGLEPHHVGSDRGAAGCERAHSGHDRRRVGRERRVGKTAGKLLIASVDRSATGCDA